MWVAFRVLDCYHRGFYLKHATHRVIDDTRGTRTAIARQQASWRSAAAGDLKLPTTNPVVGSEQCTSPFPSASHRRTCAVVPSVSPVSRVFRRDISGVYGAQTATQNSKSCELRVISIYWVCTGIMLYHFTCTGCGYSSTIMLRMSTI